MLKKLNKSKNEGFTIIEVMIVLAIAGLILLIVFLAVPSLQRNSRNTQRKSDVGRLGSAATTVVSNLNGQTVTTTGASANFTGGASGTVTTEAGSLGYYDPANVSVATGAQTNGSDAEHVTVVYGAKCSGSNTVAATRQIALIYATETGGSPSKVCVDQ